MINTDKEFLQEMILLVILLAVAPVILAVFTSRGICDYMMRFLYFSLFTSMFIVLAVSQFYDKISPMQLCSILYFVYLIVGFIIVYAIKNFEEFKQKGLTFILNMIQCKA